MSKNHSTVQFLEGTYCCVPQISCVICNPAAKCIFCESQMEERRISDRNLSQYKEANKNLHEVIYDLEQKRMSKDKQIGLQQGTIGKLYEDIDAAKRQRDTAQVDLQIELSANNFLRQREEQLSNEVVKLRRENDVLKTANNAQREEIVQLWYKLQYEPSPDFAAKIDALKDEIVNLRYLHSNQRETIVKYMGMLDEIHKISDRLETT